MLARYTILAPLGEGGLGRVYRAHDQLLDQPVAIKLLRAADADSFAQMRRELAALRWLRLPGVVALRDDGVHDGQPFLVMDVVHGQPFPGREGQLSWAELEGPARRLLETLDRIHRAGGVHRDLKPANVRVEQGRVVVLDLGLASGRAVEAGPTMASTAGSPSTMAPEQIRGEVVGPAADLYAAGVMLFTALAGHPPHEGQGAALLARRLDAPAPPLRAPGLPTQVQALVEALLARDPARRPASARAALERLGAPPPLHRLRALPARLDRQTLRRLFTGPSALSHVPEDAAALLHARAGSDRANVLTTLDDWLNSGCATWSEDRVTIDRAGLERLALLAALDPRRPPTALLAEEHQLTRLIAGRAAPEALLAAAEGAAAALIDAGQLHRAEALLAWALSLARQEERLDVEQRLLVATTRAALGQESGPALDRARYQLERALIYDAPIRALDQLLQAARAAWAGEADRAEALLSSDSPLPDEALEILARGLAISGARRRGPAAEEAAILALDGWIGARPERAAWRDGWLGNLRYRQGRYDEAATLHQRAAAGKNTAIGRLSSRVNAACALLEAGRLDDGARLARRAAREARALRLPVYEGVARFVARCVGYREGRLRRPDPALAAAAAPLGPGIACPIAATEAAIAWRAGRLRLARRLAAQARQGYASLGLSGPALLMAALELACDPRPPVEALASLAARARDQDPDFAIQCLGLLRRATRTPPPDWLATAQALATARPAAQRALRLDVLSYDECLR